MSVQGISVSAWSDLCELLRVALVEKLAAQDHNATGRLSSSVEVEAKELADRFVIEAKAEHYGKYVNNGRRIGATMPPISAILQWIEERGIGNDIEQSKHRSLAFVIARSIKERGITPAGGYSEHYAKGNSIERLGWADRVLDEKQEDIEAYISQVLGEVVDWIIFNKYKRVSKFLNSND